MYWLGFTVFFFFNAGYASWYIRKHGVGSFGSPGYFESPLIVGQLLAQALWPIALGIILLIGIAYFMHNTVYKSIFEFVENYQVVKK